MWRSCWWFSGSIETYPRFLCYNKKIKKNFNASYADENILYFNEDSSNAVLICKEMGVLNTDLNNINLDNSFDEDDRNTIIIIRLLTWHIKLEIAEHLKRS